MEMPKFHETFMPILKELESGEMLPRKQLRSNVVTNHYSHLPEDILNKKYGKSGYSMLINRIHWGVAHLKFGKFVSRPVRGMIQITPKGKKIAEQGSFTLQDLKQDSDYIEWSKQAKERKRAKQINQMIESDDDSSTEIKDDSPQDLIDKGFNALDEQVKSELLEKLTDIDPYYFERVILELLKKMGYGEFIETSKSNDGGIDGVINEDQLGLEKIYIQAKRYSGHKVRETDIRNFIGAMSGDTSKGVFVTTSGFDAKAIAKAREAHHTIILIDGNRLVNLMYQYGIGVQVRETYEVKEVDEDFFEID